MALKQRIKDRIDETRKQVEDMTHKATSSITGAPVQLVGAWTHLVEALRHSLDLPTRDDFAKLTTRVEELASKVEHLARERVAEAASKVATKVKKSTP